MLDFCLKKLLVFHCRKLLVLLYRLQKIYSNAIFVQGEVKKDSIECFHIGKGIYFVWADVTYSTKENNSVIVAKASFWDIHGFSWRVMNRDKDFSVLIGYNPDNGKESIVYLKEAFERTV